MTKEEDLFVAAEWIVRLRDLRVSEMGHVAEAWAIYTQGHRDAVHVDAEMAAALEDFRTKANDYQKPSDAIP